MLENTRVLPTPRQQALAEVIQRGEASTATEALRMVGYSETVAVHKPGEVVNSRGVKMALAELGMSEENAAKVVNEIMHDKSAPPSARLTASDMTFKVHGTYAPVKTETVSLEIDLEALQELRGVADAVAQNMRAGEAI